LTGEHPPLANWYWDQLQPATCWKGRRRRSRTCINVDDTGANLSPAVWIIKNEIALGVYQDVGETTTRPTFRSDDYIATYTGSSGGRTEVFKTNGRYRCPSGPVSIGVVSSPDGDIEDQTHAEYETSDLTSCVWDSWGEWQTSCGLNNELELGRRTRDRHCKDISLAVDETNTVIPGFANLPTVNNQAFVTYSNTNGNQNIQWKNRQIHLCPINGDDLVQPEWDYTVNPKRLKSLYSLTCEGEIVSDQDNTIASDFGRIVELNGVTNATQRAEMLAAGSIATPPTDNSKRYCERLQEMEVVYCNRKDANNRVKDEIIKLRAELNLASVVSEYTPPN